MVQCIEHDVKIGYNADIFIRVFFRNIANLVRTSLVSVLFLNQLLLSTDICPFKLSMFYHIHLAKLEYLISILHTEAKGSVQVDREDEESVK